ncbi:MAG: CoA transferase subunit A [Actinobacteria bacterium]|nr:MAG: CoA transferase subunit A [Actinomycetota bacterium]
MADKRMTEEEVVAELEDGMTIGIGGWGSRRKPMSIVRAILRSPLKDLTVVSYAGPDLGLLCAAGKVRRAVYSFVSLDSIALEPHFRAARQNGLVEDEPWDEGLFVLGLQAAAWRVPFLPSRAGLGSDLLTRNPRLRTVRSPYADGEELVAAPALVLDAAIVHMNRGDAGGNGQFLGPDLYFDDLFLSAATRRFMSVERIVPTGRLLDEGTFHTLRVNRLMVDGVVEAPNGAHFTSCAPDYERDESFQREYAATAKSPEAWDAFRSAYLDVDGEAEYQRAVTNR